MFEARTIESQARLVQSRWGRPAPSERQAITSRMARHGHAPLSSGQRALWFLWKLEPESTAYTLFARAEFAGNLDVSALRRAFGRLVERHEPLRTRFDEDDGLPRQLAAPEADFEWLVHDLSNEEPGRREEVLTALATRLAQTPFDLLQGPLLRVHVVRLSGQRHALLVAVHHIAVDAGSSRTLWRELSAFYEQELTGIRHELSALALQYADYAAWQSEARGDVLDKQLAYWRGLLGEERPTIDLPGRLVSGVGNRGAAAHVVRHVPVERTSALRRLAQVDGTTLSQILLAAFDVLLHRYCGERQISVGVPMALRGRVELEPLIGYFVNPVVHRATVRGELKFRELLAQVRTRMLEAHEHRELPFERLVAALEPTRSSERSPLFAVTFNHRQIDAESIQLAGVKTEGAEVYTPGAPFDWTLDVCESATGLRLSLDFPGAEFDHSMVEQALEDYLSLLAQIVDEPEIRVSALRLTTARENALKRDFTGFFERFAARAAALPDAVAVLCEGESLRYAELLSWSKRIGRRLELEGAQRGERIGLAVERSPALIAGLLGILSMRGAFVPLDPSYPKARLESMIADAGVRRIVTDDRSASRLRELLSDQTLVVVSDVDGEVPNEAFSPPHPDEVAYVMFTSGSSGRPKGVEINQRALSLHIDDYLAEFEVTEQDTVLQFSTVNFDAAIEQMLPVLTVGGRMVMRGPELWSWDVLNRHSSATA